MGIRDDISHEAFKRNYEKAEKKKPIITNRMQQVAADILTSFAFVEDKDEFLKEWKDVYKRYELCEDPFTHLPCSCKEYAKNSLEYDKQTMIARYGHCDGLE